MFEYKIMFVEPIIAYRISFWPDTQHDFWQYTKKSLSNNNEIWHLY